MSCYVPVPSWSFVIPWTAAQQAPPSMEFSRQAYSSGLPFPSLGDLPNPGIKLRSRALQADSLPTEPPGKLLHVSTQLVFQHPIKQVPLSSSFHICGHWGKEVKSLAGHYQPGLHPRWSGFDCKESTPVIMEAGKSQAIQGKLASWRSREVNCVVPVWMLAGSKPTKKWYFQKKERKKKTNKHDVPDPSSQAERYPSY